MGHEARQFRRAQVTRVVAVVRPLDPFERDGRAVAHHRRDDVGEVTAELGHARADPHDDDQQLERDDHVDERQDGEEQQRGQVLLTARGQEHRLVPQPGHDQQHDHGDQQNRVHQPGGVVRQGRGQRRARHAGQDERDDDAHEQGHVEHDVEPGAPVAGGERHPPPRPQPDGAGPGPEPDAPGHRLELAGQRAPGPRHPDRLEQHRPQHRLLVDNRLVPPARDIPEWREVRRPGRHYHAPENVAEQQFHDVDRVYHPRRAESVLDPVQGEYLHPLHERLL